jgi:hypothetical protein
MAVLGVARPQGGWTVAIFYPFGHPMPYVYAFGIGLIHVLRVLESNKGIRMTGNIKLTNIVGATQNLIGWS